MFGRELRVRLNEIQTDLDRLQSKVAKIEQYESIDCETCGCLVDKGKAIKGKSKIRIKKGEWEPTFLFGPMLMPDQEYIYTPYYCKRCAPKERDDK